MNPFQVQIAPETFRARGASPGGFGIAIGRMKDNQQFNREQQQIAQQQAQQAAMQEAQMQQEFSQVMSGGTPKDVAAFAFKYPKASELALELYGVTNEATSQISEDAYAKALMSQNNESAATALFESADSVSEAGGNPQNMISDAQGLLDGSVSLDDIEKSIALTKPDLWNRYNEFNESKKEKFQQGTGEMSGYSFNPDTGRFSIDKSTKERIESAKSMPSLDAKTRQSINKDFTQLTKDTKLIRNMAADLDKLSKIKSGPASIAMVFKFMKALDPTSVVREGEFATAENSAGIPEAIRNTYNKLMEGGRLGDKQTKQFVYTAKSLANSAIESSNDEITSFIDTFEDTLPEGFKKSLKGRIPKSFSLAPKKEEKNEAEAPLSMNDQARKWANENPNDPRAAKILARLGG